MAKSGDMTVLSLGLGDSFVQYLVGFKFLVLTLNAQKHATVHSLWW